MMKIRRTLSTPGLLSLLQKTAWVLTLVSLISVPGLTEENDEYSAQQGQNPDSSLQEILEALKEYADSTPRETQLNASPEDQVMNSRVRKAGTGRPKFDPGYKWIGLGKRPSVPYGPHIISDLRYFFESARDQLANEYMESTGKNVLMPGAIRNGDAGQDRKDDDDTLKFVHRSKESGARKNHYNPSLLWTGLGR